jgi:hypothetical protein
MDEKELQAVTEALNQLREGGTVSAETLEKLGGTTQSANKALATYTQKLLGAAGSIGGMGKAIADGEGSFKSLGSSITGLTGIIGNLASAIPLVGGAAKALADGVGQAAKFVLEQLDTMAKNYQTLGDASAGAADGVDGLLRQFNQMGNYSLPAFTKAVKANTQGLAALSGTAASGAEQLSLVSGALTKGDTAQRFLKLGMSLDAVGDATTSYLADSARYGLTQGNTTEELTKKTQNYIEEVDKIARLTGQTREAQQKEAQKSLVDARFRAKLADMAANGQTEQAEELRKYVEGLGGAAGDAARALATGIPLTKEAAQANLFTNDALRQNTIAIQDGKKATVAIAETQQAMADGTVRFGKQIMYAGDMAGGMAVQAFDTAAMLKEQNKLMATGLTREQAIDAIQKKQMLASGKSTEEFTSAQLATAGASKDLQALGFTLAKTALPAVDAFATGLKKVTGFIDEKFGSGVKGGAGGESVGTTMWNKLKNAFGLGSGGGSRGTGPVSSDTERIMDTIRRRESGGNYSAQAKGSSASGAYQFIDSTWQAQSKKAGVGTEFKSAKLAPKEIQDAVAKSMVEDILKQAGGDVSKVPLAWYTGNVQGKISPQAQAANNGLTPEMYQQKWMNDYSKNNTAGPMSGYKPNKIEGPTAGTETTAQSNNAAEEETGSKQTTSLSKQLAEFNHLQRESIAVQKKILARQS